jgi:hypothetical protein
MYWSSAFLIFAMIDLSAVNYSIYHNKYHFLLEYLSFKANSPIWRHYQTIEAGFVLLFIYVAVKDFIGIFTKKANTTRQILDAVGLFQLITGLSINLIAIMPLQNQLIASKHADVATVHTLSIYYSVLFALNLFNWFVPIIRYQNYLADPLFQSFKSSQGAKKQQ